MQNRRSEASPIEHVESPSVSQRSAKIVLVIDYYFPPLAGAAVHRTLGYVRHLAEFGWSAVVLTAHSGAHYFYDPSLLRWIPAGLPVRRTASLEPVRFAQRLLGGAAGHASVSRGRGAWAERAAPRLASLRSWLLFPDAHIGWLPFAVGTALSLRRRFPIHAIYSTSTAVTSHLIGSTLKTLWKTPWVADFQDPWTEEYANEFPTPLHRRAAIAVERRIVRQADRVTMTTEPMREGYRRRYPAAAEKFHVIPMGFDPEAFADVARVRQPKFTMTHFGNFYGTRSPEPFLNALAACLRREPALRDLIEVRFLGALEPRLRVLAESFVTRHEMGGVLKLLDSVPYPEGIRHLVGSDVLLLIADSGGCGRCLVPSKLFEYFGAGRPVLALAPDGAIAGLVREAGAGLVVSPDDVGAIEEAILTFYRGWRASAEPTPARQFVASCTWRARTAQFAMVLDDALGTPASVGAPAQSERAT